MASYVNFPDIQVGSFVCWESLSLESLKPNHNCLFLKKNRVTQKDRRTETETKTETETETETERGTMVLVHLKQSEDRQFLYECPASQSVDFLIREVVLIHNLQLRLLILASEGQQLCLYGPSRLLSAAHNQDGDEEDEDDSDDEQEHKGECSSSNPSRPHGPFYLKDPSRKRTGEG